MFQQISSFGTNLFYYMFMCSRRKKKDFISDLGISQEIMATKITTVFHEFVLLWVLQRKTLAVMFIVHLTMKAFIFTLDWVWCVNYFRRSCWRPGGRIAWSTFYCISVDVFENCDRYACKFSPSADVFSLVFLFQAVASYFPFLLKIRAYYRNVKSFPWMLNEDFFPPLQMILYLKLKW